MSTKVITRFAPSPTGFLHIGGARTALFNWLYARHYHGKFLLRIEDTDYKRSTKEAIDAIISGLKWLDIDYDEDIIFQSKRISRHREIVNNLINIGSAYYCYCTEEYIEAEKISAKSQGIPYRHQCKEHIGNTNNQNRVVRFKVPLVTGNLEFEDQVYGKMSMLYSHIDDMIILRSDNTPTYMFAVVVDDHDMNITHVIRGNDHLVNTFKQILIYKALDWDVPQFSHVPLIHGEDGNKLSKRHGALGVEEYKNMGILPEAMCNYLLRLGWSYGDNEIIHRDQAVKWFCLENIGKSCARLDSKKLEYINWYYLNAASNERVVGLLLPILKERFGDNLSDNIQEYLLQGLNDLKQRAKTLNELVEISRFYAENSPITLDEEALVIIKNNQDYLAILLSYLSSMTQEDWNKESLLTNLKEISSKHNINMKEIYHVLRAAISGTMHAPSIINIMVILGKNESIMRLKIRSDAK